MRKETDKNPSLTQALVVLLLISMIVYFVLRAAFVSYAKYGALEKTLGILFLLAEGYVLFHAFGFYTGIYRLNRAKNKEPEIKELSEFPHVSILVPARHEPKNVLEDTITSCYNLSYPSKTIILLDDSSEQKYKDEAEEIANKFNCRLFRREDRHGAKAGVINDCLKTVNDKYIVVFDADQNPIDGFLKSTIAIMESDRDLALVQTPQYYSNLSSSRVALASNMQQAAFYEVVCEAKSASQAMICCGTNVVIRKEALDEVGGFDETTVTEDFATSFQLHQKGWKTLYYNHVSTFGQGPENLGAYLAQQNRWAMGNVEVLKKVIARFFKNPSALKPVQWWEYIVTGSYYLVGWSFLFLLLCPIIYMFFNLPSFFMDPVVYCLSFLPYLILASLIFYLNMKGRNYTPKDVFKGQLLFFVSLPTCMRGTLLALLGIKRGFQVTAKEGSRHVSYLTLWPQLSLWALNLAAIAWGVNRFIYDHSPAVLVNMIWITYHIILLSSVFYFNEDICLEEK